MWIDSSTGLPFPLTYDIAIVSPVGSLASCYGDIT